ncbi:hypothetical protein NN3_21630 [Nocardia neocaledoniensis NBRC 108232]|nr:hypothetical protein NN3_21630 [Nocardia neocaledoniensis NBRC 108232]
MARKTVPNHLKYTMLATPDLSVAQPSFDRIILSRSGSQGRQDDPESARLDEVPGIGSTPDLSRYRRCGGPWYGPGYKSGPGGATNTAEALGEDLGLADRRRRHAAYRIRPFGHLPRLLRCDRRKPHGWAASLAVPSPVRGAGATFPMTQSRA